MYFSWNWVSLKQTHSLVFSPSWWCMDGWMLLPKYIRFFLVFEPTTTVSKLFGNYKRWVKYIGHRERKRVKWVWLHNGSGGSRGWITFLILFLFFALHLPSFSGFVGFIPSHSPLILKWLLRSVLFAVLMLMASLLI